MASERQIAANRANAQKSTGPKSQSGKKRSSANSYRHGLSLPMSKVGSQAQLKDLSRQFSGGASDAEALAHAERAADAQLQLDRVRRLQNAKIEHALKPGPTNAKPLHPGLEESGLLIVQTDESPPQPQMPLYSSISLPGGADENEQRLAEMGHALLDLIKISRYEKRAAGQRDRAISKIKDRRPDRW
jgi:hypothetical protein